MITIVDYDMGNIGSIRNMLKKIGVPSVITNDPTVLDKAEKLIIPGVGAFDRGMKNLVSLGLVELLNRKVLIEKKPVLGICLGMQLLSDSSEEGSESGLGWIQSETIQFDFDDSEHSPKIPHMGWNHITICKSSKLFNGMNETPRFYFVHSYHVFCKKSEDILATCKYGIQFTAAVERRNVYGVQFHPEKSHKFGMKVLENFSRI